VAHPGGTVRVSSHQAVGLISGNGNHCNYFVGELRRYTGDPQTIADFYAAQAVPDLGLLFIENGEFPALGLDEVLPYRLDVLSAWLDSPAAPRDHLYLVYLLGIDLDPGWDMRCH